MSTVRSARSRFRARAKIVALAGAVTLVAAACTSSGDTDSGLPLQGIDDDKVKVGYLISDISNLNLGFVQPNYGTTASITKGIQAVVDWVNQNGGAGGRDIVADIVPFDGALSSPEQSQQLCAGFTQDKKVFAAVLDGQYQNNTLPCYKNANTLMIDQTVIAHDQTQFEQFKPYLWSPTHPEYGSFLKQELQTLVDNGFFEGAKGVQLMPSDDEVSRRAAKSIAEPFLKAQGITKMRTDYVDSTNTGTLGASAKAALVAGKSAGTDRVVVIGGARILPVVLADFEANDYNSKWAITTVDNPLFVGNNGEALVGERREGMVGIGYNPSADVTAKREPAFPDPANPAQQQCVDILTAAGAAPPNGDDGQLKRENWRTAFLYCDATMFIKAALDRAPESGDISANAFAEAVGKIGTAYSSAQTFGSNWTPGTYAGSNVVRTIKWDSAQEAFVYEGENITLPAPEAVAPATTAAAPEETAATPAG
jgi:hypothetical protein